MKVINTLLIGAGQLEVPPSITFFCRSVKRVEWGGAEVLSLLQCAAFHFDPSLLGVCRVSAASDLGKPWLDT